MGGTDLTWGNVTFGIEEAEGTGKKIDEEWRKRRKRVSFRYPLR